jgi:hypothetical protein
MVLAALALDGSRCVKRFDNLCPFLTIKSLSRRNNQQKYPSAGIRYRTRATEVV